MADENIGSVKVQIVADYSQLASGLRSAQDQAKTAGSTIASAFTSAVAPASALTQATDRLRAAQAAVNSEGAKFLATIQADNIAYGTAQASLEYLNNELKSAQQAYNQASAAATNNASTNQQAAGAATQAATATQGLAAAQVQAAAGAQGIGAAMAAANATLQQQTQTLGSVSSSAAGSRDSVLGLYAAVTLLRVAFRDLEEVRKSEIDLLHLSEATGVSTERLAQFREAVNRMGGDGDRLSSALGKMARDMEAVQRGTAKASDEFRRLGITSKDPIEAFLQMGDTIYNTKDKFEAYAAATTVTGLRQTDLIAILGQGRAAFVAQMEAAKDLAKAEADGTGNAQDLTVAQRELHAAFEQLAFGAMPALIYGIKLMADGAARASNGFQHLKILVAGSVDDFKTWGTALGTASAALSIGNIGMAAEAFKKAQSDISANADKIFSSIMDLDGKTRETVKRIWSQPEKPPAGAGLSFQPPEQKAGKDTSKKEAAEWLKQQEEDFEKEKFQNGLTAQEEINFWAKRIGIAESRGVAYAAALEAAQKHGLAALEHYREDLKKNGQLDLQVIEDNIKATEERVREAGGNGAGARQQMLQSVVDNPQGLDQSAVDKIAEQIPKAQADALKESKSKLHASLAEEEAARKDSFNQSAAQEIAFFEARKAKYAEDVEVVKHSEEQIAAARKRQRSEDLQVGNLETKNTENAGQAEIAQRRIKLESDYALQSSHTYQQQIEHQQQLAALQAESLRLELAATDAEVASARQVGTKVDVTRALNAQAQAQRAIDLQAKQSEADRKKLEHDNSFGGQVDSGLKQDAQGAVSKLSGGIADLVTQTKGWGQVFKGILKDIERSIVETFANAALKQGLNAILNVGKPQQAGGGGVLNAGVSAATTAVKSIGGAATGTAQAAAQTANTAALTASTAAETASTAATTALVAGTTAVVASETATTVGLTANTVALTALTASIIALTDVEAVAAILPFAAGGRPPVGVPSLVGEQGMELFIPDTAGTIIPADKTKALLAQVSQLRLSPSLANVNFAPPGVPSTFGAGGSDSEGSDHLSEIMSQMSGVVTNHNTGRIGDSHFSISGVNNPREIMRQISDFEKRQTGKYSPANS